MSTAALTLQIRTFIAIALPAPVLAALVGVQQQLATAQLPLRLSAPAGLHLTLAFIGEMPAVRGADLAAAVAQGVAGIDPFTLRAEGHGMFPNARAPRVVWVGVQGDPAAMAALTTVRQGIVRTLAAAGFPTDPRFDPHLTLARVADRATPADRARIGATVQALPAFPPVAFGVDGISVMRSDQQAGGAVYSRLAYVALGAGTAPAEG